MLEKILSLDSKLFVYLNGLGSAQYDEFWLFITKQFNWIPFFLVLFFLIYKKFKKKQFVLIVLFVCLLVSFTDQSTNLIKNSVERLRPCSNPDINLKIRIVKSSETFSFFSGHASNTMAVAMFLYLLLRSYYKYFFLIFLWPFIFAYSRIYLGLHYPLDILCGYLWGIATGILFLKLYQKISMKMAEKY